MEGRFFQGFDSMLVRQLPCRTRKQSKMFNCALREAQGTKEVQRRLELLAAQEAAGTRIPPLPTQ
jgi:hypothetical protein